MTEQERAAALAWVEPALEAIAGVEKDIGKPLDDDMELGQIYESQHSPSFRIRVGHIRKLAALRAYARPAPADLRMAAREAMLKHLNDCAAIDFAVDAVLSLLPQTRAESADPDWYYCDIDPDDSGDSAYQAMVSYRPRLEPVVLHTSYIGPTLWGVMAPPLPGADDNSETAHTFRTKDEAVSFCAKRRSEIERLDRAAGKEG